jgi:ATP dependent DNA ligase-like protein
VEQLRFLERSNRTLGQAALLWLLKDQRIASTLPNIYDEKQLAEFAASSECPELADDEIERIAALYDANFLRTLFSDLNKIRVEKCPFFNLPAAGQSRWDQGLTAAEMKRCHWVKPEIVCQIKFTEWTRDDRLRQPVFLGIRKTRTRTKWFGNKPVSYLDSARSSPGFLLTSVLVAMCKTRSRPQLNLRSKSSRELVSHLSLATQKIEHARRPI